MRRVASVAAISIFCVAGAARAGDMQPPRITRAEVDWTSASAELAALVPQQADGAAGGATAPTPIARLNAATAARLPGIAASPVPVLLPLDVDGLLHQRPTPPATTPDAGKPEVIKPAAIKPVALRSVAIKPTVIKLAALDPSRDPDQPYWFGFGRPAFFSAGPAGYDATFRFSLAAVPELADIRFAEVADIAISGFALTYDLDPAPPDQGASQGASLGASVPALEAEYPGIRRVFLEDYVRYTFVRYGVPYVVSTDCFDAAVARFHHMACRDADRVIQFFLHKLHVAGGLPPATATAMATAPLVPAAPTLALARPPAASPTFTYYGPGRLLSGTGYRGNGGRTDDTVYSNIRFPLAEAPAFLLTQYYWQRVVGGLHAYPWRDNFCENRAWHVTQCPGGMGHQGEDIAAAGCNPASLGDDGCTPHRNDVIAVRDGAILRAPGQEAVWLIVNTGNEHIRFRYLHMRPKLLDAAGVLSGRSVKTGELLGQVGNFDGHENGTSYHLHFDIQVPTRLGWLYVSPYMTLVAAYERLIGGRGAELSDDVVASTTFTLNDVARGPITLAAIRVAILGSPAAPPVETAPRPHWRHRAVVSRCGRHWRGCAVYHASVHFRGNRWAHAYPRHYPARATAWRFRRRHS